MPQTSTRRVAQLIFLVVGIAAVGFYCESYLYRTAYQMYQSWQFDRDTTTPAPVPATKHIGLPAVLPNPDRAAPRKQDSNAEVTGGVVGRISIPRLDIAAIVEEGVDDDTLSKAVGHIPGTAMPGEEGNMGIAGHRDTFFRKLKDLQPNDKIDFTTHTGRYHYIVDSLTVVEPSDVSVLESKGGKSLTIVTCFPFHYIGNAPRRFIVHARLE